MERLPPPMRSGLGLSWLGTGVTAPQPFSQGKKTINSSHFELPVYFKIGMSVRGEVQGAVSPIHICLVFFSPPPAFSEEEYQDQSQSEAQ